MSFVCKIVDFSNVIGNFAITIYVFFFCSFSDRGKRLKLQQFIAKKADTLYDKSNLEKSFEPIKQELGDEGNFRLLITAT